MKGYSQIMAGVLVSVVGGTVATIGLSESCSNEITAKVVPMVPVVIGGIMSWVGRFKKGDVTLGGFRKR